METVRTKPIKRELLYEMYIYFNSTNKHLDAEIKNMPAEQIEKAVERGLKAIDDAQKNGVKNKYVGQEEIGIYIIMQQYGFDFDLNLNGSEILYTPKMHKYNVGDEITVKIASVTEVNGKDAYGIKGIEKIKFAEGAIDAMAINVITRNN